jgi:hypothetical protein
MTHSTLVMNPTCLRSATADELRVVDQGIARFSSWFNVPTVTPHRFEGRPEDISKLDWVFYELGGGLWHRDNGMAFTCVWGNVLVRSFGFEWAVMEEPRDFRDYQLHCPETYRFFPWCRLWEQVENPGAQFSKSEHAWLRIIGDLEEVSSAPRGWHPAIDAIRGDRSGFPEPVVALLKELSLRSDRFVEGLGMWPYEWSAETNWSQVQAWLAHRVADVA